MSDTPIEDKKPRPAPIPKGELTAEEKAELELNEAKAELEASQKKVKEKQAALKALQLIAGNEREAVKKYRYDIDTDKIAELYEDKAVIYGMNDLFRQVLIVKEIDEAGNESKNPIDLSKIQISERIRKQGMKRIQEYCVIHKESPRIFYIKAIKDVDDMRTLRRKAKIAGLKEEIAKSEHEADRLSPTPNKK